LLVDSHCHLDFDVFDEDRAEILQRAKDANIYTLLTICTHVSRFERILFVANSDPNIWCSVGIHPHQVGEEKQVSAEELATLAQHPKVIGIGETGLDYYYDNSPRGLQRQSLKTHIQAARESQLPLIIHSRDADGEMGDILEQEMTKGSFTAVLHCFSSGKELALRALRLGFYISLSGIVTFKNAEDLREIVQDIPLERLLVETDAPFLSPIPNRGKRNEPSFVIHTAAKIAEIKNVAFKVISDNSTNNFFNLFNKAIRPALK
tara:strand:+ start:2765 stop:3553 length:789 start_codon:yes stop_codon:yes gene_type:complete